MTAYDSALEYLTTASLRGSKLGLERIVQLLEQLGNPQEKVKIIHISGTNGKGSFGAMLGAILTCAGYCTGSFSSPAIADVTDSFRINGAKISQKIFGELICRIAPICESMDDKPTEFEILTAAAYELFAENNCDIALVECGMGGDLDSTNAVSSPLLSVITNVQMDHCSFLGNTIGEIALHKAGIIKKDCPVLFGGSDNEAARVIEQYAANFGSRLYYTNHSRISNIYCSLEGTCFNFDSFGDLYTPLSGTYQARNAANVLTAVEILRELGYNISSEHVRIGLEKTKWHGRFEILRKEPLVIFDGSHNPDGIRYAADSISCCINGKIALLIGVMADKKYELYADLLGRFAECVFTVKPDNPRALDSDILAKTFTAKGISSTSFNIFSDGVKTAYCFAKSHGIPLVALGSLYMYKEFTYVLDKLK